MARDATGRTCGRCGSADVVPIVYGLPDADLGKEAEAGRVLLGGCCVGGDDPIEACRACGATRRRGRRWEDALPGAGPSPP